MSTTDARQAHNCLTGATMMAMLHTSRTATVQVDQHTTTTPAGTITAITTTIITAGCRTVLVDREGATQQYVAAPAAAWSFSITRVVAAEGRVQGGEAAVAVGAAH